MRTLLLTSLPLVLALGCRQVDEPADLDGDGYDEKVDCDDDNPDVFPDADEVCNGIDDDCDEIVDEDAIDKPTWYLDADADGYGDPNEPTIECEAPANHVLDDSDCDDSDELFHPGAEESDCTDPNDYNCDGSVGWADEDEDGFAACEECDDSDRLVNPDAVEVCDGIDNDCSGQIDGPDAVDALAWYADLDGDGFGDPLTEVIACEATSGYVDDSSDCDDTDAAVSPDGVEVCNGTDDDCDGTVDGPSSTDATRWFQDTDGDGYGYASVSQWACEQPSGYVADNDDCDDWDDAVYPGATEVCNSTDDDCDGDVDEEAADASTWYLDADEDGYGAAWLTTEACEQPSGYVSDDTDCDDLDDSSYPGGTEVCDEADNDCDGTVDEDDSVDAGTWYADDDGDSYGDASDSTTSCEMPSGYVANATDCDDTEAASHPGGTEVCDDIDNDCDGDVDSDAVDGTTWYADADSDGYGDATSTTLTCDMPSGYTTDTSDCDDTSSSVWPGADEYCNGIDDDCDGTVDEADALDVDTWYLDVDGDGYGYARFSQDACSVPSGYVSSSTDCDDLDDEINPGADEYCDGIDNDCNGSTDEDSALDVLTWYADADLDGFGDPLATDIDCDQPSGYLDNDEDCDDTDEDINPLAAEVCDTLDNDCDGTADNDEDVLGGGADCPAISCDEILDYRTTAPSSGAFYLDPDGSGSYLNYCDMSTDGGGWTLVWAGYNNSSVTWGSGWNYWYRTGGTTTLDAYSDSGKSEAYDDVTFSELMLTAEEPNWSTLIASLGTSYTGMPTLLGSEPTSCSGLYPWGRRSYTASRTGSYWYSTRLDLVVCDNDGTSLETTGAGNHDMAVFSTYASTYHGDHHYADGVIGSEWSVGAYSYSSSTNQLGVWVR